MPLLPLDQYSPARVEHIRQQNRERKRRQRERGSGRERSASQRDAPFIGIDGEGGGTDSAGRQNYLLMCAATDPASSGESFHAELFDANRPLSTVDCLEFILSMPREAILVGYFFGYDSTQILRDLPAERIKRLFQETEPGRSPYTYWRGYAIEYRPRQYFRVARATPVRGAPGFIMRAVPGSARTVNETGGFFQSSFVNAVTAWKVANAATLARIAAGKEGRASFTRMTAATRRYCLVECRTLARLLTEFRLVCEETGTMPASWRGAGAIAAALHRNHQTPRRRELEQTRPTRLMLMATEAYYGGRFEVTRIGGIPAPVYEYDINSAYPAAMLSLPCPVHTRWRRFQGVPPAGAIEGREAVFVARVVFTHRQDAPLCHLPFRRQGRLLWPREGSGTYWNIELDAARAAGTQIVEWGGGYHAERCCDCRPFEWVAELYAERKRIGKATRGYPIKLGINGLYGKLAQRQGGAPYRDMVAAGIITAATRAKLIGAYAADPAAIVMIATDGLFSLRPLPVDVGAGLGQWETKTRDGIFVVQPGIYWSGGIAPKTRGIPKSEIISRRAEFEWSWLEATSEAQEGVSGMFHVKHYPSVRVPVHVFYGHRLALHRNRAELAGSWADIEKEISFDWSLKRAPVACFSDGHVTTLPHAGALFARSAPYDPQGHSDLEEQLLLDEGQPDFYPWGNQGE